MVSVINPAELFSKTAEDRLPRAPAARQLEQGGHDAYADRNTIRKESVAKDMWMNREARQREREIAPSPSPWPGWHFMDSWLELLPPFTLPNFFSREGMAGPAALLRGRVEVIACGLSERAPFLLWSAQGL